MGFDENPTAGAEAAPALRLTEKHALFRLVSPTVGEQHKCLQHCSSLRRATQIGQFSGGASQPVLRG
jgi:hypothetical protein